MNYGNKILRKAIKDFQSMERQDYIKLLELGYDKCQKEVLTLLDNEIRFLDKEKSNGFTLGIQPEIRLAVLQELREKIEALILRI